MLALGPTTLVLDVNLVNWTTLTAGATDNVFVCAVDDHQSGHENRFTSRRRSPFPVTLLDFRQVSQTQFSWLKLGFVAKLGLRIFRRVFFVVAFSFL